MQEANLDYLRLVQTKTIADMGIPLQVRSALSELQEAKKNIEVTRDAYENAKKWLVIADANFDLGVGDARDLSDAAISYAKTKADYLRNLYNEKIGFANLANVTGKDISNLK